IESGSPYEIVQRLRRSDGIYRWFQNRGFPLRDPDGRIVRWCVLFADIDDAKRAEHRVRTSERNLNLIINTIPTLAWAARPDGSVEFINQRWLDYTGIPDGRNLTWTPAIHPDDRSRLTDYWRTILVTGEPGETEARLRRFDGAYRWFLFRA